MHHLKDMLGVQNLKILAGLERYTVPALRTSVKYKNIHCKPSFLVKSDEEYTTKRLLEGLYYLYHDK